MRQVEALVDRIDEPEPATDPVEEPAVDAVVPQRLEAHKLRAPLPELFIQMRAIQHK